MPFITLMELVDIAIMTFAIGFIFSTFIKKPEHDIVKRYERRRFNWSDIKFSIIVAAPAVVLHELSHKFVALGFGAQATLHAPYTMYAIVIMLKLINFPIMFFVGGYVTHTPLPALQSSIVSIAGPLINLALWLASMLVIRFNITSKKHYKIIAIVGKLNMFLFIFNMLPIPGFDGYSFFANILPYLF